MDEGLAFLWVLGGMPILALVVNFVGKYWVYMKQTSKNPGRFADTGYADHVRKILSAVSAAIFIATFVILAWLWYKMGL